MLSIAIFTECYHPMRNGVVVSIDSFARVLSDLGHRVTIFTAHHPDQHDDEEGVYRFASITFPTRARYPVAIPIATGEARERLRDDHFDLIHSNSPMLMGHVAVAYHHRRDIPLVFTYHTMIEEYTHYIPLPQHWLRRRAAAVTRTYANGADHIITPTQYVANHLRRIRVVKPITVVPTGIDVDLIDQVPPADVRAEYDIPAGVPLLTYAGRIAREKNLPRLLGAFREILTKEPDAHLLLIGGGPDEHYVTELAEELGIASRLRLTGYVDRRQVIQGFKASDVCVFASRTETQGLVLGEAMACGTPVVAVDVEVAREAVTDGEGGLLVPDDDRAFAEGVLVLLRDADLRRAMGRSARTRAESLSAQRCTERLLHVYHRVARREGT